MRQRTRKISAGIAGAMVLPLALAACGSSSSKTASPSAGASSGGGSGIKSLKIGFQGPLSGSNSPNLGINAIDGVKLAIQETNDAKKLPYTLTLDPSDSQGLAAQGPTAARKLVDDKVSAVIGPMFSNETKASEPIFSAAGILSVSPSATNATLTHSGFKTFVRVIAVDSIQGKAAADYLAKKVKAKKVFSLDDNETYGTGLAGFLETELKAQNVSVTHDSIAVTKDYTSEATKIIGDAPDAVYYSGYYSEFALLSKALRGKGYTGTLASGDGSADPHYVTQAGASNANDAILTCACGDANSDPKAASFVTAFKKLNGVAPGTYSAEAYDATNALVSVLEKLGNNPSTSAIVDAYKKVDFQGLTKTIKFTDAGDIAGDAVYIYQVKDGKIVQLGLASDLIK